MRQAVEQHGATALTLEDLPSIAEGRVTGDLENRPLVVVYEHPGERPGAAATDRNVVQFVFNQQVRLLQLGQEPANLLLLLRIVQSRTSLDHPIAGKHFPGPGVSCAGTKPGIDDGILDVLMA